MISKNETATRVLVGRRITALGVKGERRICIELKDVFRVEVLIMLF